MEVWLILNAATTNVSFGGVAFLDFGIPSLLANLLFFFAYVVGGREGDLLWRRWLVLVGSLCIYSTDHPCSRIILIVIGLALMKIGK